MLFVFRRFKLMRASLLALLVLGVVIKPVLASAFELHAVDHPASAQGEHEHRQADPLDPDTSVEFGTGVHELMHDGSCGGPYFYSHVVMSLPVVPYEGVHLPLPPASPVPLLHLTGPFRPPIA